ncbi:excalibur calcium-binding domain-containing protein [Actinokineospora sp. UTMC 2448]|uniref:excalibur calcium-binding domain-containing protein n=1 Tax=Actinokineospora sp. UTMC 2448 TaxID=2268449 RepID=UPI002164E21A|nr:excalibur calcium-binding domain-containing protein [Actinokineospora sp. UTMC 2448]UVS76618.1 Excalibur calcium-binding domain protein [Actinokineospora sp. UTMC 2448]
MTRARPTRSRLTTATAVVGACAVVWLGSDLSRTRPTSAQLTPARPATTITSPTPTTPSAPAKATVSRVVDARTVLTSAGDRIVVAGLAPPGPCWATAATDFATVTLLGTEVTIVDPTPILAAHLPAEPSTDPGRSSTLSADDPGRATALSADDEVSAVTAALTLPDGSDYAATALHLGHAKPTPDAATTHHAAATAAGAALQGLWGQPCLGDDILHVQVPPPAPNPTTANRTPPAPKGDPRNYYRNCAAARASGNAPIPHDAPGYRPALDRDHNGLACER